MCSDMRFELSMARDRSIQLGRTRILTVCGCGVHRAAGIVREQLLVSTWHLHASARDRGLTTLGRDLSRCRRHLRGSDVEPDLRSLRRTDVYWLGLDRSCRRRTDVEPDLTWRLLQLRLARLRSDLTRCGRRGWCGWCRLRHLGVVRRRRRLLWRWRCAAHVACRATIRSSDASQPRSESWLPTVRLLVLVDGCPADALGFLRRLASRALACSDVLRLTLLLRGMSTRHVTQPYQRWVAAVQG